jgi:hypothetical protein
MLAAAVPLSGCLVRTAVDVVTLPVKAVSAGVDAVTTSQSERDERRGREMRREDERRGREAREREGNQAEADANGQDDVPNL